MAHVDLVDGQTQALCRPAARQEWPAQHGFHPVNVFLQLSLLLNLGLRVFLRPSYQLILTLRPSVQQRPLEKLLHVLPPHLACPCAQKPSADIVLWMRYLIPKLPEKGLALLLGQQRRMLRGVLQRALAGDVDEQPKGGLDDAPREQEPPTSGSGVFS